MKIKRDVLLTILCIAFFLIASTLLAIDIQQEKVINKQNKIIALQSEQIFNHQNINAVLEQQLDDERLVSNTLYDLAELHGILQEVK